MRYISPFDNGSYHMVTIGTNRTNRQLGKGFLTMQRLRNIVSPPNEMLFSIRQRIVSTNAHLVRIDDSKATAQLFLRIVSIQVYWTTLTFLSFTAWWQVSEPRFQKRPLGEHRSVRGTVFCSYFSYKRSSYYVIECVSPWVVQSSDCVRNIYR